MIPFTPTQEELPRLLSGEQSLIVRAVEPQPYAGTCATGIDFDGVCYFFDRPTCGAPAECDEPQRCPLGAPGDVVFCQEEWAYTTVTIDGVRYDGAYIYCRAFPDMCFDRQPPETMTEKHSRIYLRIKSVDCRRVQTVTPVEAIAAGHGPTGHGDLYWDAVTGTSVVDLFSDEWDRNNPDRKTVSNPWAWFAGVEGCERP